MFTGSPSKIVNHSQADMGERTPNVCKDFNAAEQRHQPHCGAIPKRFSMSDAGQAPNITYSHWFTPTNAVSIKNQGLTTATSTALRMAIVPAIANNTRSNGHFFDVFISISTFENYLVTEIHMRKNPQQPLWRVPVLFTEQSHRCGNQHHSNNGCV